ncbi:MAG: hypothetical protein ACI8T1_005483, partial [Verrucomicrobiales bacterium]
SGEEAEHVLIVIDETIGATSFYRNWTQGLKLRKNNQRLGLVNISGLRDSNSLLSAAQYL